MSRNRLEWIVTGAVLLVSALTLLMPSNAARDAVFIVIVVLFIGAISVIARRDREARFNDE
jgi:hypothetical protein